MAKTNVLDTDTVNFGDIIGNGKIYRVPLYQRDYSWEEENWDDLWQDIINLQDNSSNYHYMGAIVLQDGSNEKEFFIIDGQQRLVTLSIIAIAVIEKIRQLKESGIETAENEERVSLLRNDYLGRKNPSSLFYSSKLFLNKNNDNFYQTNLLQFKKPINPKSLNDSDKLLWHGYNYFLSKLSELEYLKTGRNFSDFLTESVARQLLFIQISVQDEINAYTVFETLNARGVELTSTDLLKNYLFSLIKSENDLQHIQKQWEKISDTVSIKKLPEFLRVYINSKEKLIRKDGLFKAIKNKFENKNNERENKVIALLDELEKFSYFYQALSQPNHDLWRIDDSCAKDIRNAIKIIDLFKVKQIYPLLFAAYDKFYLTSPDKFYKVLDICLVISFRYNIIGGKNPNELEKTYNEAAIKINDGSIKSPQQIFQALKRVYISDDIFINDFSYKTIKTNSGKRLIRYILFTLEFNVSSHNYDFDDDLATIEHILPENPSEIWESVFPYKEWESNVYRLGNYTLLEQKINREIKNKSYIEKQSFYQNSQYQITQDIQSAQWNRDSLQLRQENMAKMATLAWRVNDSYTQ